MKKIMFEYPTMDWNGGFKFYSDVDWYACRDNWHIWMSRTWKYVLYMPIMSFIIFFRLYLIFIFSSFVILIYSPVKICSLHSPISAIISSILTIPENHGENLGMEIAYVAQYCQLRMTRMKPSNMFLLKDCWWRCLLRMNIEILVNNMKVPTNEDIYLFKGLKLFTIKYRYESFSESKFFWK